MSTTTAVPNDVATRRLLVATETFKTQNRLGFSAPNTPRGYVMNEEPLGETNIYAGQGRRHPKATFIEGAWKVGEVIPESELVAAIAAAQAKQAAVPAQQQARRAQREAAAAKEAEEPPLTAEERAAVRALLAAKPPV